MLVVTHLPLTVIGSMALAVYGLLLLNKTKARRALVRLFAAVILALAASARYWVTMISELGWLRGESDPWFDYRYNFLFWKSVDGATTWWANILGILTLLLMLPGLVFLYRPATEKSPAALRKIALLALGAFFMATPLAQPIWAVLPGLKEVQFPWRWLAITSLAGAVIIASSLAYWFGKMQGRQRPLALLALACLLIPCAFSGFQIMRGATYIPRTDFAAKIETLAESDSLPAWLPVWTGDPVRPMRGNIEAGTRELLQQQWSADKRLFQVEPGLLAEVRVRTFYYPHWVVKLNDRPLATRPATDGVLVFELPAEGGILTMEFVEPSRVGAASLLSLGALVIIAILLLQRRILPKMQAVETGAKSRQAEAALESLSRH